MTAVLEGIQTAVTSIADGVGPSVAGLGRGWGRGSGFVVAPNRILTNAHVLRGDEVAVTFAGDEPVHGRVAGVDADLDVAVVAADTGDRPAVTWDPAALDGTALGLPVFALADPGRARPARHLRPRLGDRPLVPRPPRPPHRRLDRALGAAAARLVRRAARRRRGTPARRQHRPARRRADPRPAGRRRFALARRRARAGRSRVAPASRRRARAAARRAPDARRRRPPRARGPARARRARGQPGGQGRDRARRPDRARRRPARRLGRRSLRRDRGGGQRRWTSVSSAGPRS